MIYTSRYSNRTLWSGQYYAVGISRGRPKFRLGYRLERQCYDLAPPRDAWGKSTEEFRRIYLRGLDAMGADRIRDLLADLERRAGKRDLVLLCFEDVRDPEQHCHRRYLAEWLSEHLGMSVPELPDPGPVKAKHNAQMPGQISLG